MWFFLVGYVVVLGLSLFDHAEILTLLNGFIYFFGAMFVLTVVQVGKNTFTDLFATTVSKSYVENIVKAIPEVVIVANQSQVIRSVNQAAIHACGYQERDLLSRKLIELFPEFTFNKLGCEQPTINTETILVSKSGQRTPVSLSISILLGNDCQVLSYVCLAKDITEQKQTEAKLEYHASHDTLTGLPNRAILTESLESAMAKLHQDPENKFGILFIDLDYFKDINDRHGHFLGDELLKAAALRLEHCVRQQDLVCRLGGDEFVVLINHIETSTEVELAVKRVLACLEDPFELAGNILRISGSIGYLTGWDGLGSAADALRCADEALYRAKASGRACAMECEWSFSLKQA